MNRRVDGGFYVIAFQPKLYLHKLTFFYIYKTKIDELCGGEVHDRATGSPSVVMSMTQLDRKNQSLFDLVLVIFIDKCGLYPQ